MFKLCPLVADILNSCSKKTHHSEVYLIQLCLSETCGRSVIFFRYSGFLFQPEALKSLYRSPGNKKKQLVLCKNYVLQSGNHLGIPINIKNMKFVKDLPMIDAQFRFNQCNTL